MLAHIFERVAAVHRDEYEIKNQNCVNTFSVAGHFSDVAFAGN